MNFLPTWIKNYKRSDLKPDIMAGLTVGVIVIPQGMAYAMIAGLPPIYGLYASTVPLIIYGIFGSSRHLSVGPVAIESMLTASAVGTLAMAGTPEYISLAIILSLLVGLIQFSLGISGLGVLIKFLSHPVIQGFTSAAAIIIGLSQLKYLLGIEMNSSPYLQNVFLSLVDGITSTHFPTLAIGIGGIIGLVVIKKLLPAIPAHLIMVVLATVIVAIFRLDLLGVRTIGIVPSGLPPPGLPEFNVQQLRFLLPSAFAIALISFMESLAIARSIQARHKTYTVDSNKELLSLGIANISASFFKSSPVSGGFSRSAVNDQAGARTGLSSVVTGFLVIGTLLFLTPLFYYLPNAILASIIMAAVVKLIHFNDAKRLWNIDRKDFIMMIVTFIATLFLGIGTGIGIGVLLSLARIIFEASYPHYAELGRIPGTRIFRNVRRFKELIIEDDILIFRFDAPLFFANVDRFRDVLEEYISSRETKLKAIIVDMESINSIDTSALQVLAETVVDIQQGNTLFLVAEVKGPVRDKFFRSGLTTLIGEENFFLTIDDALDHLAGKKMEDTQDITLQSYR